MNRLRTGFSLIEVMVVVLIIGILLAVAVPSYINSRTRSTTTVCIRNLAKIDMAKEEWAMANNKSNGDACTMADISPTFVRATPSCPSGGLYTVNPVGTNPACSLGGAHSL
jgi:prepilin-type N-terminal cleavage/methylation domain-containing protein